MNDERNNLESDILKLEILLKNKSIEIESMSDEISELQNNIEYLIDELHKFV